MVASNIGTFIGVGLLVVALFIYLVYEDEELVFAMVGTLIGTLAMCIAIMGLMLG